MAATSSLGLSNVERVFNIDVDKYYISDLNRKEDKDDNTDSISDASSESSWYADVEVNMRKIYDALTFVKAPVNTNQETVGKVEKEKNLARSMRRLEVSASPSIVPGSCQPPIRKYS